MRTYSLLLGALALGVAASSAGAQVWNEVGDAGQNGVSQAQVISGSGPLAAISGALTGVNDVDLYAIQITDEANFLATTVGGAAFDTQLFLFNADGSGQVENDDFAATLQSGVNSDGVFSNGLYYLAISSFNADPLDINNVDPFGFDTYPGTGDQRMPVTSDPLASWDTFGGGEGVYRISLTGASFVEVPEPASLALVGLGGLAALRRRRA